MPLGFRLVVLFVMGAIVGSFLNVCIYRIPFFLKVYWPPSHCQKCRRNIAFYDNVPILSWLILRGRCRYCKTSISVRYACVELLTAVLFAFLYWAMVEKDGLYVLGGPPGTGGKEALLLVNHWRYFYYLFLLCAMIVATFIDLDHQIIPDEVTIPGMLAGLGGAFVVSEIHLIDLLAPVQRIHWPLWLRPRPGSLQLWYQSTGYQWDAWFREHPHWHALAVSVAGFVVGGGIVWSVRVIGRVGLGKEAMGFGDVTLMAMIGSFVGWQAAIVIFFAAPLFELVAGGCYWLFRRESSLPYGPYLCLATIAVLLGWKRVWSEVALRMSTILELGLPLLLGLIFGLMVLLLTLLLLMRGLQRLIYGPEYYEELELEIIAAYLKYETDRSDHYTNRGRVNRGRIKATGPLSSHLNSWTSVQ